MYRSIIFTVFCALWILTCPAIGEQITWTKHMIDSSYHHDPAWSAAADMDGDGDIDLVTGATYFGRGCLSWWENDGAQNFSERIISNAGNFWTVEAVDIDLDNDMDILVMRDNEYVDRRITLWINDGSQHFSAQDVLTCDLATIGQPFAADLDRDNDLDIIVQDSPDLIWLEHDGALNFNKIIIASNGSNSGNSTPYAIDLDGDLDIDLVCPIITQSPLVDLTWWENDGYQNFTKRIVKSDLDSAQWNITDDIDCDGDIDILLTCGDYYYWGKVLWFENDGNQNFTEHIITDQNGSNGMKAFPSDLDHDGDVDIVASSYWSDWVKWFENDGSQNFTEHSVGTGLSGMKVAKPVDIDRDGDIDLLGTAFFNNDIAWWESDLLDPFASIYPDPLVAGQPVSITANRLDPLTDTYLAITLNGLGATYVPMLNVTLGLSWPKQVGGVVVSDAQGTAAWTLTVPYAYAPFLIWAQAAQHGRVTNVLQSQVTR